MHARRVPVGYIGYIYICIIYVCVHACVCVSVRACVRACVRVCVCATFITTPPGHPELAIRTIIMAINGYNVLFTG